MDKKTDNMKMVDIDLNKHGNTSKTNTNTNPDTNSNTIKETIEIRLKLSGAGIELSSIDSSNLNLSLPTNSTVQQLKDRIVLSSMSSSWKNNSLRGRYIRLIYSGRLLAPDSAVLTKFNIQTTSKNNGGGDDVGSFDSDGANMSMNVIHVVIAAKGVTGGQQAMLSNAGGNSNNNTNGGNTVANMNTSMTRRRRRRRLNLRGVGIGLDGLVTSRSRNNGSDDRASTNNSRRSGGNESDDSSDLEEGMVRSGLDRLRADGLARSEINAIRTYFGTQIDQFAQQTGDVDVNDEEDHDPAETARIRRLRMEELWMDAQGPMSEFRLNINSRNPLMNRRILGGINLSNSDGTGTTNTVDPMYMGPLGTDRDFMWGLILGYFVGFFMMFWVWIPTVPHRQKLGILIGICVHMAMNLIAKDGEGDE